MDLIALVAAVGGAALFRLRSPFAAMIALFGFIAPLVIPVVTLFLVDALSGWLMLVYLVWSSASTRRGSSGCGSSTRGRLNRCASGMAT